MTTSADLRLRQDRRRRVRARAAALGVELLSTGGTAKLLADAGLPVTEVADHTGFPGDARRPRQDAAPEGPRRPAGAARPARRTWRRWREHGIATIDLLVVNLYPFEATVAQRRLHARRRDREHRHRRPGDGALGGQELARTSRCVTDASQYAPVLAELKAHGGESATRPSSRSRSQRSTAPRNYDGAISDYLIGARRRWCGRATRSDRVPGQAERPLRQAAGPALRREPAPARRVLPRPAPGAGLARQLQRSCRARSSRTTTSPTPTRPGNASRRFEARRPA